MRAASIVFPFGQTFRRLELEKRWWHRLCVVIFFAMLLCTAAFSGWIAYMVFAPQLATMPDITTGFSDEPHISSEADVDAILTNADRATLSANDPYAPYGGHSLSTVSLKQLGQRIKAKYPVYNTLDDEEIARSVLSKYPQFRAAVNLDKDTSVKGLPPGAVLVPIPPPPPGFVPLTPPPSGSAVVSVTSYDAQGNPITFDLTSFQPIVKILQMPDGSTSRFASSVSDDAIKKQWNHAKMLQTWKAVGAAVLSIVLIAVLFNYLLQGIYRALLYVILAMQFIQRKILDLKCVAKSSKYSYRVGQLT